MTVVDLLRHGEAGPGLCLGRDFDVSLTERGWVQMRAVLPTEYPPWKGVITSPLNRCAAFADEVAGRLGVPCRREPRLRELGFGEWEGRSWNELCQSVGESLLNFQRDPLETGGLNPAPGGEAYGMFVSRVGEVWKDVLSQEQGGHWLLVAHAGVIREILRRVLGFPSRRLFAMQVPHACLTRIEQAPDGPPRLVFHAGRI